MTGVRPDSFFTNGIAPAPAHATVIKQGDASVYTRHGRTQPDWARTLYQRGHIAGHVAARRAQSTADGYALPPLRTWELCRLDGPAETNDTAPVDELVALAERTFDQTLWASCAQASWLHIYLVRRGWKAIHLHASADAAQIILIFSP